MVRETSGVEEDSIDSDALDRFFSRLALPRLEVFVVRGNESVVQRIKSSLVNLREPQIHADNFVEFRLIGTV